jgi:hypothetical protein
MKMTNDERIERLSLREQSGSEEKNGKRLFHYTVGAYLPNIIKDGQIELATAFVHNDRPAVWFTTKPDWEETANKMLTTVDDSIEILSRKDTELFGDGLIRIEILPDAAPYSWKDFRRLSGVSRKMFGVLDSTARKTGANPELEWRVSFTPVKKEQWLSIEKWNGKEWETLWRAEKGNEVGRESQISER